MPPSSDPDENRSPFSLPPATRNTLIVAGFFLSLFVLTGIWVGREAERVRQNRKTAAHLNNPATGEMRLIPPGKLSMGGIGDLSQPDELPLHDVKLSGFYMDAALVTNEQFARFVGSTRYVTAAERPRQRANEPELPPELEGKAASYCFRSPPAEPPPAPNSWWCLVAGADWRHPEGEGSTLYGREKHPVVHVSFDDAAAYARWAGKRLPTEAEWEYAARGGVSAQIYVWGNQKKPGPEWLGNLWQGVFPFQDRGEDGFRGTSPVTQFPANPYGLHDMAGNAWQWTADWYRPDAYAEVARHGRDARLNPTGPDEALDPAEPGVPKKVARGGSFLSGDEFGQPYRVSARRPIRVSSSYADVGFRCVRTAAP